MLLNYAESIISPYKFFSYLDLVGYVKDSERSFTSKAIADFILSQPWISLLKNRGIWVKIFYVWFDKDLGACKATYRIAQKKSNGWLGGRKAEVTAARYMHTQ